MTDDYDRGVQALREVPVPDQWEEITARAARRGLVVPLDDPEGWRRRRRWPMLAAVAASVAVLVGAVALVTREDPDGRTVTDSTTTTTTDATTSTTTDTTTTTSATAPGAVDRPTAEDLGNQPASACSPLFFATTTAPSGIAAGQQDPQPNDPRVPSTVHSSLIGVFPGETTTRAVFVIAGWPDLGVETGTMVDGPFPGTQTWTAPYDDGWIAEIPVPLETYTCPATLIGLGINETDFRRFLAGLTLEG
jgi:hypothetical protein